MNDLMSFGMHRVWKQQIFDFISAKKNDLFMDLAGGSGDLSKLIKDKYPDNRCVLVDANPEMIIQAKKKLKKYDLNYTNSISEKLPFKGKETVYTLKTYVMQNT